MAGPTFDDALRLIVAADPTPLCRWLDHTSRRNPNGIPGPLIRRAVRLTGDQPAPGRPGRRPPDHTRFVDLLTDVNPDGEGRRLMHVEYQTHPEPGLALRMLDYRLRVMRLRPRRPLDQHVLFIARGRLDPWLRDRDQLAHHVHVTLLRDQDPRPLLTHHDLAPLAALAHAPDLHHRAQTLAQALNLIIATAPADRCDALTSAAAELALIYLPAATINQIGKELPMPFTMLDTPGGQDIYREGRTEGLAEGRASDVIQVLTHRFGDDPRIPGLARCLSTRDDAVTIALTTPALDHLTD